MSEFRAGNSRVLIATDIWGRGRKFKKKIYYFKVWMYNKYLW